MCALVLALMLCCGLFAGCQQTPVVSSAATDAVSQTQQKPAVEKQLKYVFLFIGDGMSYPQFQAAADYLGALAEDKDGILNGSQALNFMQFPVAGSTIADTVALADAVDEALKFYEQHPDETLILVTGDHETGGLTIGYAGTDYDTYLDNLENQKISYAKYDSDYVTKYVEENTSFETVMQHVKALFGLMAPNDPEATEDSKLVLTDYEYGLLEAAYQKTMSPSDTEPTQEEYVLYGSYEPISVTITHLLNNKSGIHFSSYAHTGLPVAVFAQGEGSGMFEGYYDNTQIYHKLAGLLQISKKSGQRLRRSSASPQPFGVWRKPCLHPYPKRKSYIIFRW